MSGNKSSMLIFSVAMVNEISTKIAVFSNIELYQNHSFRLSIDGFGFGM